MEKGGEKLADFERQFLTNRDLPMDSFWIYGSHMCPLLARQRTGPSSLGLARYGPRGGGCKNGENGHKMVIFPPIMLKFSLWTDFGYPRVLWDP